MHHGGGLYLLYPYHSPVCRFFVGMVSGLVPAWGKGEGHKGICEGKLPDLQNFSLL